MKIDDQTLAGALRAMANQSCRTYTRTNEMLAGVQANVLTLIEWAEADAEHAAENDAPNTAKDHRHRAHALKQAFKLLEQCKRSSSSY